MNHAIKDVSISELSRLTGMTRETIVKRTAGLKSRMEGTNRLFNAKEALHRLFVGKDGGMTPQDRLAEKKTEQIDLEMEVKRRERVPVEDVEEHQDEVFQNMAGVIKAHEGKLLSPDLVQELFSEMRRLGEVLSGYTKKAGQPDTAQLTEDDLESALAEI